MSAFKIKLKEGGLFMKIKLFYFIISCIFAILTSTNNRIDRVHSQFIEKEQNILLLEIQESKIKNYTPILVDKIEPANNFTNKLKGKFDFFYEDIFRSEINKEIVKKSNKVEILDDNFFYYTILYRYKSRVLRI